MGFPIRKSLDQSPFAAPQGLSQRTTSFIASQHQGIHQIPLLHLIDLIIHAHPKAPRGSGTLSAEAGDADVQTTFYHPDTPPKHRSHTKDQASRLSPLFKDQLASTLSCRFVTAWRRAKAQNHVRSSTTNIRYGQPGRPKPPKTLLTKPPDGSNRPTIPNPARHTASGPTPKDHTKHPHRPAG